MRKISIEKISIYFSVICAIVFCIIGMNFINNNINYAYAMSIEVKDVNGNTYTIEAETSDSIDTIKIKIEEKSGISVDRQRIIYAGKELQDGMTLADYNYQKGNRLHLVLKSTSCTHELSLVNEIAATCVNTGTRAYYTCSKCSKKFEDENGTTEITNVESLTIAINENNHSYIFVEEVLATETTKGQKAHYDCANCHKHFDSNYNILSDLDLEIPVLQKKYIVNIDGGSGSNTYIEGQEITITANKAQEGMVFVAWENENGEIISSSETYTFLVSKDTTLTAVYEKTSVLLPWQIACIVVGSVIILGSIIFTIIWFSLKKKSKN